MKTLRSPIGNVLGGQIVVSRLGLWLAAGAGLLLGILSRFIAVNAAPQRGLSEHPHSALGDPVWELVRFLSKPELTFLFTGLFAVVAVLRSRKPGAWIYALLAGIGFSYVFFYFILPFPK